MLHIILLILKIIGIILLCILGVLLLAVCCALFVPLRYRIEVFREEGEGNPPFVVRAKVTWLLHLVNVLIRYPADVYVRVRLFLFTLFRIPEAEKKRTKEATEGEKKQKRQKKDKGKDKEKEQAAGEVQPAAKEQAAGQAQPAAKEQAGQVMDEASGKDVYTGEEAGARGGTPGAAPDPDTGNPDTQSRESADDTEPEPSGFPGKFFYKIRQKIRELIARIRQLVLKLKTAFQNIVYTIRHLCDKIKSASETIQYYKEVLESDAFRQSWELCKGQTGILLKALKPDKFEADLIIGTGDPASTGEILAWYGMLYPFLGEHVRITGDFERAHVEGFLFIKGKIRAFTFLRVAWKVYRNRNVRTLIKLFKKEAV